VGQERTDVRLHGWWGNDAANRFEMAPTFRPSPGAKAWQHSCTPVFSSIPLLATLELIDQVGFDNMREKSKRLTGLLEELLMASKYFVPSAAQAEGRSSTESRSENQIGFKIITPPAPFRGTQLSLSITPDNDTELMPKVFSRMLKKGLVGDERRPTVIRLSPVVLYNRFEEVGRAVEILEDALREEEEANGQGQVDDKGRDVAAGDKATTDQ
jgi:kynureninase